nr:unnamed protein product [Callosobruchus chinensis]
MLTKRRVVGSRSLQPDKLFFK